MRTLFYSAALWTVLSLTALGASSTITTAVLRSGYRLYEDLNGNRTRDAGETFRSVGMAVPNLFYHADRAVTPAAHDWLCAEPAELRQPGRPVSAAGSPRAREGLSPG